MPMVDMGLAILFNLIVILWLNHYYKTTDKWERVGWLVMLILCNIVTGLGVIVLIYRSLQVS